jgi:hypothetical protein
MPSPGDVERSATRRERSHETLVTDVELDVVGLIHPSIGEVEVGQLDGIPLCEDRRPFVCFDGEDMIVRRPTYLGLHAIALFLREATKFAAIEEEFQPCHGPSL